MEEVKEEEVVTAVQDPAVEQDKGVEDLVHEYEEVVEEPEETTEEMLKKGFGGDALQVNSKRTGHDEVGVKPQYVVERLNDTFGYNGWFAETSDVKILEKFVLLKIKLKVGSFDSEGNFHISAYRESFGGSRIIGGKDTGNVPDSIKGAATDALKKAASHFDIGGEVYKGNVSVAEANEKIAKQKGIELVEKPEDQESPICPKCGAVMAYKSSERGNFWGCSNFPKCKSTLPLEETETEAPKEEELKEMPF